MQECAPRPCKFCESALARYTCPRCNCGYCSTKCYKDARHQGCSEDFYKDCVQTYLHMEQANPEAQKKMVDILKAVQKEEEEEVDEQETDEVAALVQRLEHTDIDAETAWSYLTPDERQEFERMVQTGDVGKLVPLWKPWWEEKVLVTEVTQEECPKPTVQPLSALTSKPPAACVVNSVLNILCSYVHVIRLYNGEMVPQSAEDFLSISLVLTDDAVYGTPAEAVQAVLQKIIMSQSVAATEELPSLLGAFRKFLGSPQLKDNALRALDETRSVFDAATREPECNKELKLKLRRAVKKVEYMMSWTIQYGDKLLSCLNDIDVEALAVAENMSTFQDASKAVEEQRNKASKPRVLIEELN
uniref:HIT-type domain-containing protein n=1 Tax=Hyalomma excavatum TaxID=257692 RepID=A0A131XBZ8_9ACAR